MQRAVVPGNGGRAGRWSMALVVMALGACGAEEPAPSREEAPDAAAREVAIQTPAGAERVTVRRYSTPEGFALPFVTDLPEDLRAEPDVEGTGDAISFTWYPAGERHDSAVVHLFVLPADRTEDAARAVVQNAAERVRIPGDREEVQPIRRHAWARVEYPIRSVGTPGAPVEGWVALSHHAGRWFYIIAQARASEWPRFEPRAELMLERWRWLDSGEGLGGGAQAPG